MRITSSSAASNGRGARARCSFLPLTTRLPLGASGSSMRSMGWRGRPRATRPEHSAPMKLSVLDQSPIRQGGTPAQAVAETLELARAADRLGYSRYWLAEHHSSQGL